jgi:phosphoribosylanthranilate isomerase
MAVKICGLTRPDDARLAVELGAAAVGVVLAGGPRHLDPAQAARVLEGVPPGVARVGVFVDPDPELVAEAVRVCALDWIQLSGTETPEQAARIMEATRAAAHRPVGLLKAVHVASQESLDTMAGYPADAFLLDAPAVDGRMGGTGRTFSWGAAAHLPWDRNRVVLAGGLTAENLAAAVAAVRPAMVDVSSGVEQAPGIKDAARMSAFLEAARQLEGSMD